VASALTRLEEFTRARQARDKLLEAAVEAAGRA